MIAQAKYNERMEFAKSTLEKFKDLKEGNRPNGLPLETNIFVGCFNESHFNTEGISKFFFFNVMGFSFSIQFDVASHHGKSIITFTTREEVKDIDRLAELKEKDHTRAPYIRIDDLSMWIDESNCFHYNILGSNGNIRSQYSLNFISDAAHHYLMILQRYIEDIEKKQLIKIDAPVFSNAS